MRLSPADQRRRHYLGPDCPGPELVIRRMGVGYRMPPIRVHRPAGTDDYLLMVFHDPVQVADVDGDHELITPAWILWSPGQRHHYGNGQKSWVHSWLHCQGPLVERFARRCTPNRLHPLTNPEAMERQLQALSDLVIGDPDPQLLRNASDSLFLVLHRPDAGAAKPVPAAWQATLAHINRHFSEPLRASSLARQLGVTAQHFAGAFRRHHGVGFRELVLQRRIDEALHLLRDANLPISRIGAAVGYDDPFQFSRLIKRRCGASPRELRRRLLAHG